MFNAEQRGHMEYIFALPREKRCACGWFLRGECSHPDCMRAAGQHEALAHPLRVQRGYNDRPTCDGCGQPWPCAPYREARAASTAGREGVSGE